MENLQGCVISTLPTYKYNGMQSVVILRALELSASKVSLSRLVFWWLRCVPVLLLFFYSFFLSLLLLLFYFILFILFLFLFFFSVVLRFFRVFFYSNFLLLGLFINLIYAQSVSFTCFQSMSTFTPFVCSITPSALLFFSYAVPQFAYSDTKVSCLVLLN